VLAAVDRDGDPGQEPVGQGRQLRDRGLVCDVDMLDADIRAAIRLGQLVRVKPGGGNPAPSSPTARAMARAIPEPRPMTSTVLSCKAGICFLL
jgi:hypothetical protein